MAFTGQLGTVLSRPGNVVPGYMTPALAGWSADLSQQSFLEITSDTADDEPTETGAVPVVDGGPDVGLTANEAQ